MPAPATVDDFLDMIRKSELVDDKRLDAYFDNLRAQTDLAEEPMAWARALVRDGILTKFQAEWLLGGRYRGFRIGKYKVLERIGGGGGGNVFLCEHVSMRNRVAVKVLNLANTEDPVLVERFYREARAGGLLEHPNIIRTFDVDQDKHMHYLVLEFVEGTSLRKVVQKFGPLEILRAVHYIRQAAEGLQHLHDHGLVHRDINPGNLVLDRQGVIKILDLGVARFLHDADYIPGPNVMLGTADYLAPEQAKDSHTVDSRADLYSLGAAFYFMLTGQPPFAEAKTMAQKLIYHQTQPPRPIRVLRPEVPDGLVAIIDGLMAKDPEHRYQNAAEVIEALAPWTMIPIPPPPPHEMPKLCPAAANGSPGAPVRKRPTIAPRPLPDPSEETQMNSALNSADTAVSNCPRDPEHKSPQNASPEHSDLPEGANPRLVILRGLKPGAEFPLEPGRNLIGRFGKGSVAIDLSNQEKPDLMRSSRQHAVLFFENNRLAIEDLNSTHGTFVNWARIEPKKKVPLNPNDVIQIAMVQMKVVV